VTDRRGDVRHGSVERSEIYKPTLIFVLVWFAGAGCFGISSDRYSKPSVERTDVPSIYERYVGDMYVLGDVDFHIFPVNTKGTEFMIFPAPCQFAEPHGIVKPFSIGVALKVKAEGYAFSPSSIKYWSDPAQQILPSGIRDPFGCGGHTAPPPIVPVTTTPIPLAPRSCVYMWFDFDTAAPDPAQTFFVALSVLFQDKDIALPVVKFQPGKRTSTFALP
jgi:hypothetical protein